MGQIKTVLSDMDGVLVRAVEIHRIAFNDALEKVAFFRIPKWEHERDFNGLPTKTKLRMLANTGRIQFRDMDRIYQIKQEKTLSVLRDRIKPDNAIINIGKYWKECDFRVACVTNAIRQSTELMLEYCGILPYIDLIISNEDVKHPKPNPDGYLQAMKYFNVELHESIIIEDAPKGLAAAIASGCPNVWNVRGVDDVHVKGFRKFMEENNLS